MRIRRESRRQYSDGALTLAAGVLCVLVILSAAGCATEPAPSAIVFGKSTEAEARGNLREPVTERPAPERDARLLCGSDSACYQIENRVAVAHARTPAAHERTLQYWRHKWRGQPQRYAEVPGSRGPHGQAEFQLTATSLRKAVIYDPSTDRVLRVVEYGLAP
jgi:hypothetical protein